MLRRLPITLWLYLLADLWKLVLITTGVLVTVIAFAAAVKPLADGKLGPEDTLRFMMYAILPMLQYALPFAACFGATLAYHRLSTDNELTAVHAGGISHRAMLVPALVSGLVLAAILLALSNSIIPRFLKRMSVLVAQDAAKVVASTIERGEALQMDNTLIYADRVVRLGPDEASGAYERLSLLGALVVRTGEHGEIEQWVSPRLATVWLRRTTLSRPGLTSEKPMTEVVIRTSDTASGGQGYRASAGDLVKTFLVPNAFGDNVKFLSFSELRELRREPERMDRIDKDKRTLAMTLAGREMVDSIDQSLRATGMAKFLDPYGTTRLTLYGSGLRTTLKEVDGRRERDPGVLQVLPPTNGKPIVVETMRLETPDKPPIRSEAKEGAFVRIPPNPDPDRGAGLITIQLMKASSAPVGPDGEVESPAIGEVTEQSFPDLRVVRGADDDYMKMLTMGAAHVEELARKRMLQKRADEPVVMPALATMREDVRGLINEILSKEQERYAMSVACLVMVLIGSVMAMRLRDALPLTVYLWAFFPALATVLAISGGQQLTHGKGIIGLPVLWAGVVALGSLAVAEFVRLCKH
jgi:lipopolysaccharide export LptBFGC system permease protein LptF